MILIILLIIFIALTFPAWIVLWVMLSALISQVIDILSKIFSFIVDIINTFKDIVIYFFAYFMGTLIVITLLLVIISLGKELLIKVSGK